MSADQADSSFCWKLMKRLLIFNENIYILFLALIFHSLLIMILLFYLTCIRCIFFKYHRNEIAIKTNRFFQWNFTDLQCCNNCNYRWLSSPLLIKYLNYNNTLSLKRINSKCMQYLFFNQTMHIFVINSI